MVMKLPYKSKNAKLKVWYDGKIVDFLDASVPILTHSMQYGSGAFEGIRAYHTDKGPAVFRLKDHIKRFMQSAKIYSMPMKFTAAQLEKAVVNVVKVNKLKECYIRPFIFYNTDEIGVSSWGKPTSVYIAAVPFGSYFGAGRYKGIKCKISSWRRINSEILPVEAKASGNYVNSIIANLEAKHSGFDEAIFISGDGYITEASSENIFLIKNGKLLTPSDSADILLGITRDTIIKLAMEMNLQVEEREIHKEELYTCDEAFLTGTAAEITPLVNVDGIKIAGGKIGKLTKMLSDEYTKVVTGKEKEFSDWLTYVK